MIGYNTNIKVIGLNTYTNIKVIGLNTYILH